MTKKLIIICLAVCAIALLFGVVWSPETYLGKKPEMAKEQELALILQAKDALGNNQRIYDNAEKYLQVKEHDYNGILVAINEYVMPDKQRGYYITANGKYYYASYGFGPLADDFTYLEEKWHEGMATTTK